MKYIWEERAICAYYCELETGKIIATLSKLSFSDDTWHADVHGDRLGQYISCKHGKKAIEKFIKEQDKGIADLKFMEVSK